MNKGAVIGFAAVGVSVAMTLASGGQWAWAQFRSTTLWMEARQYSADETAALRVALEIQNEVNHWRDFYENKGPLTMSNHLNVAAGRYAHYLATHVENPGDYEGSKLHYLDGSPRSRAEDAGYGGNLNSIRENIAWGVNGRDEDAAHDVVAGWVNSPGHYANMMANSRYIGVGVSHAGGHRWYYVIVIGN
jgi:uncharacterized protein YkwD